eukprot:scaffold276353_cov17-Tisochrysis_lutea.AAC.1
MLWHPLNRIHLQKNQPASAHGQQRNTSKSMSLSQNNPGAMPIKTLQVQSQHIPTCNAQQVLARQPTPAALLVAQTLPTA